MESDLDALSIRQQEQVHEPECTPAVGEGEVVRRTAAVKAEAVRGERNQQQEEDSHLLAFHRRCRFPTISWLSGIHLEGPSEAHRLEFVVAAELADLHMRCRN